MFFNETIFEKINYLIFFIILLDKFNYILFNKVTLYKSNFSLIELILFSHNIITNILNKTTFDN